MSASPRGGPAPRTGLEGLIDPVDLDALARSGTLSDASAPPLRRDLHWFALAAIALMVTLAAGSALLWPSARSNPTTGAPTSAVEPSPASTAELEAAIRDQSVDRPESALSRAASLPSPVQVTGRRGEFAPLPVESEPASATGAGMRAAESDALRQARLADEAERRRADVLGSPLLAAVGTGRGGPNRLEWGPPLPEMAALPLAAPAAAAMPAVSGPDSAALAAGTGTRLARGTLLPAVLMTEVRSDLPGTLVAQVTQTVWDTVSGDRMLVPQGARLIGEYGSDLRPGRERLLAVFTRLLWPDGRVLDIGRLSAVDALGRSGLADQVDTRFAERFGAGFMVAGLASLLAPRERQPATVLVVPVGAGAVSGLGAAAGTVLVETTRAILEQQRQVPPVVIVRQGHRFNVIVQEDLTVPADPRAGAAGVRAPEDAHAAARR